MAPVPKSKLAKRRKKPIPMTSKPLPKPNTSTSPDSSSRKRRADTDVNGSGNGAVKAKDEHGKRRDNRNSNEIDEPDTQVVFEDPYGDDYEEEKVVNEAEEEHGDSERKSNTSEEQGAQTGQKLIYQPGKYDITKGEELVCDETAYDVFYKCNVEWPALSFDFVCTAADGSYSNLNSNPLQAYPLSISLVFGTQASNSHSGPQGNKLVFARMSNLHRNPNRHKFKDKSKMKIDSKNGGNSDDDDDDSDDDSDDESVDSDDDDADGKDPTTLASIDTNAILQNVNIKAEAVINRVRVMPQHSNIVAYWSEKGRVTLLDGKPALDSLYLDSKSRMRSPSSAAPSSIKPFYSVRSHGVEGYALDWSRVRSGRLLSGSIDGAIYMTEQTGNDGGSSWQTCADRFRIPSKSSVEDIQWSPNEDNVFASCHSNPQPFIHVWDTRQYRKSALAITKCHEKHDVNVISWNRLESHLLVSGGDDGVIKVWDLRTLSSNGGSNIEPAAQFSLHQHPITAVQWHHADPSMLCASSEDGSVSIWDLAVERDPEEELRDGVVIEGAQDLPPQLLFIHMGQTNTKDVQWHPACPSLVLSTAQDGFNVFQPSNIALPIGKT